MIIFLETPKVHLKELRMEFVSVRDLRGQPHQVWQWLNESGELIVTRNGKPIAVLSSVDEASLEQTLVAFRRARAQMAVSRMRAAAQSSGAAALTADDIDAELRAARKARKSRAHKKS